MSEKRDAADPVGSGRPVSWTNCKLILMIRLTIGAAGIIIAAVSFRVSGGRRPTPEKERLEMQRDRGKQAAVRAERQKPFLTTGRMAMIGVMTAVTCVLGPLSIPLPFSPVPITFTNLAIFLSAYVLGLRAGMISYFVYLLAGLVGLPVFSGFSGGAGKLAGPTGGYLIGFIFLALIGGFFVDRFPGKRVLQAIGLVLGMAVCYAFGTAWLAAQLQIDFAAALAVGVLPYLPGDALKILAALFAGPRLRREIRRLEG